MVRAVVGTLLDVGSGKITVNQFKQIVDGRDRQLAGMNVPAEGLYLVSVKYPNEIFLK
jgi:tRNA pseudouridine38-40 synthase